MAPETPQTICIIGVGLIGGSLALAWKRNRAGYHIIGCDDAHVLERAREAGAIDESTENPADAVRGADFVVIATPVRVVPDVLAEVAGKLKPGAVVTDVGSVKQNIMEKAAELLPEGVAFVGGHPMAGAERGGFESADALLFENATYVLCPPLSDGHYDLVDRLPGLIRIITATGANPIILSAERHDRIAATVSHLPQLLAISLVNLAAEENENDDAVLRLAAGGFRDLTRIASSPFRIWQDIVDANRSPITDLLRAFRVRLEFIESLVVNSEAEAIKTLFDQARSARETIPRDTKGFVQPLADLYVYAEDKPGFLHRLTEVLVEAGLNVKDIELLKIREGTGGAFRIGFSTDEDAERGMAALHEAGFESHRL